ncbi:MAG: hypothetical protein SOY28_07975 [Roseburia sp.]|nr:hypothetical protein [Roseburia sp.]
MAETVSPNGMEYVSSQLTEISPKGLFWRIHASSMFTLHSVSKTKERAGCTTEWRKKKWQSIVS